MANQRFRSGSGSPLRMFSSLWPDGLSNVGVAPACEEALAALSEFGESISEANPQPLNAEQLLAIRHRFHLALARTRAERCGSLRDVRLKCQVFEKLTEWFPKKDDRVYTFGCDLIRELAVVLDEAETASESGDLVSLDGRRQRSDPAD